MQDNAQIIRAGFGPRTAAFLLDQLLVGLALCVVKLPFWIVGWLSGRPAMNVLFAFSIADVLCYLLLSAYYILLTYFTGSTLGKMVMGLRVEREDGAPLRLMDVIYRETIGRYLSGVLCLGYLMVLVDGKKRAFHDYLCDTRVVHRFSPKKETAPPSPEGCILPGATPPEQEAFVPASFASEYTIPSATRPLAAEKTADSDTRAEPEPEPQPELPPED